MQIDIRPEHHWLSNLIGKWTMEAEMDMGPEQPKLITKGTEEVRALGEAWIVCEGEGEEAACGMGLSQFTLGFDPSQNGFVGTFLSSKMTYLWIYENGRLDDAGKVLTLDATGPSFTGEGTARYQDMIEIIEDGHRTLKSQVLDENEVWHHFMTAHYYRQG